MEMTMINLTVADVVAGYTNKEDATSMNGRLCIRPAYQRGFVYPDNMRDDVIKSVLNGFPLNMMYYGLRPNGDYEVIDGQQRTISICEFASGNFSIELGDDRRVFYGNLTPEERKRFNEYRLFVYKCIGGTDEILRWFEKINIQGLALTNQELRNSQYTGPWLESAKRYFSALHGAEADCDSSVKMKYCPKRTSYDRQSLLELAIAMHMRHQEAEGIFYTGITDYMAKHQNAENADDMIGYFKDVFSWVKYDGLKMETEKAYRNPMVQKLAKFSSIDDWGALYDKYKDKEFDSAEVARLVCELVLDKGVEKPKYIIEYVLALVTNSPDIERLYVKMQYANPRQFSLHDRMRKHKEQNGICPECRKLGLLTEYTLEEMHGDHIVPYSKGGRTEYSNLQMLCIEHNLQKSDK